MDSGNSSSMQSSSGGGGSGDHEEFDSRADQSISALFSNNTTTVSSNIAGPTQLDSLIANYFNAGWSTDNNIWSTTITKPNTDGSSPRPPQPPISSEPVFFTNPLQQNLIRVSNTNTSSPIGLVPTDKKNGLNNNMAPTTRNPKKRTRVSRRAPTTVLTTDTSNFRAMVQEFTGNPSTPFTGLSSSSPFPRSLTNSSSRFDLFGSSSLSSTRPSSLPLKPFPHKPIPQAMPSHFLPPDYHHHHHHHNQNHLLNMNTQNITNPFFNNNPLPDQSFLCEKSKASSSSLRTSNGFGHVDVGTNFEGLHSIIGSTQPTLNIIHGSNKNSDLRNGNDQSMVQRSDGYTTPVVSGLENNFSGYEKGFVEFGEFLASFKLIQESNIFISSFVFNFGFGIISEFSEEILIDKLAKLNSTQQSIENLSQWCILHVGEAELVVKTWEKQFHSTKVVQKVPLLYLANDILQNSKRQGNEFVQEFWKVLPGALKDLDSLGDESGKGVVSRLVEIWEERRVFGSHSKSLKDVMLAKEAPPPLDISKKRSGGSKSAKRDSKSSRTKSSSGSVTEKIVSAFNLVRTENSNEETETNKCKSAVKRVKKMEKDVEDACSTVNDLRRKTLAKELEEEENILTLSIEKLKSAEESRTSLVNHLKEALREQESELENLQSQIQVAQEQTEQAKKMQKRLSKKTPQVNNNNGTSGQPAKATPASIAAMAEMLTSSTNSSMIMHSVLSSFAAEATQTSGLTKSNNSDANAYPPPQNPQYHMIPNPAASQQFLPYGFGNMPLMPPPPPGTLSLPPHMMSNQPNAVQQQGQSFQPPGMMYYGPPTHHS